MKSSEEIKKLQRSLRRLRTAEGAPLWIGRHLFLVHASAIVDPERLLEAAANAEIREAEAQVALQASLRLDDSKLLEPVHMVDARWLGEVWRDLKIFREMDEAWELVERNSRYFRPRPERRQVPVWQERLDHLNAFFKAPPAPPRDDRVALALWLVGVLHGPASARRLAAFQTKNLAPRRGHLRAGRRRIALALRLLQGKEVGLLPDEERAFLEGQVALLNELREVPKRMRRKRLWPIVCSLLLGQPSTAQLPADFPGIPEEVRLPDDLEEALQVVAGWLQEALPQAPGFAESLASIVTTYGLRFAPAEGEEVLIDAAQAERLVGQWPHTRSALQEHDLSFAQAIKLKFFLETASGAQWNSAPRLGAWLKGGLSLEELQELMRGPFGQQALPQSWDVPTVRAYLHWVETLTRSSSKEVIQGVLEPETFARLWGEHRGDLAVLALGLVGSSPKENQLQAQLDLLVSMAGQLPTQARALLRQMSAGNPGLGRKHAPAFTAWLGDEPLVDRYLQLREVVGEPVEVSRRLRRDFERSQVREQQAAFLLGVGSRRPLQERALEALTRAETPAGRGWTRRRLEGQIQKLAARSLKITLDRVLREIVRSALRLDLPVHEPRWRDAVRLYLVLAKNKELLGRLLRVAREHPGRSVARLLPENQAWLQQASARMNVEAWLRPRRAPVRLGEKAYLLAFEEDPLETLKLGVPFDTCLSIKGGVNAHSAVTNVTDANKRVLYLRASDGAVVARKLLAISADFGLLGYRFYSALQDPPEAALNAHFRAFCDSLREELGIPYADHGAPAPLGGEWYDDRPVAWEGAGKHEPALADGAEVEAYCRRLGLAAPAQPDEELQREASCAAARDRGDVEAVCAHLRSLSTHHDSGQLVVWAQWLAAAMGEDEMLRRGEAGNWPVKMAWLLLQSAKGPTTLLEAILRIGVDELGYYIPGQLLSHTYGTHRRPELLAQIGRQFHERRERTDFAACDSTFKDAEDRLMGMGIDAYFDLCDAMHEGREYIQQSGPEGDDCFWWTPDDTVEMAPLIFALDPRSTHVARCLDSPKRSAPAVQAALRIAALLSFPVDERFERSGVAWLLGLSRQDALRLSGALKRRLKAQPELADDEPLRAYIGAAEGILEVPLFCDESGRFEAATVAAAIEALDQASPAWPLPWAALIKLWQRDDVPREDALTAPTCAHYEKITKGPFYITPMGVLAGMVSLPGMHDALLARIDTNHWWDYARYSEALERACEAVGVEAEVFLGCWAASIGEEDDKGRWQHSTFPQLASEGQYRKLFRRLVEHSSPAQWFAVYEQLVSARECAIFLEELRAQGDLPSLACELKPLPREERHRPRHHTFWLETMLNDAAGRCAATAQAPADGLQGSRVRATGSLQPR